MSGKGDGENVQQGVVQKGINERAVTDVLNDPNQDIDGMEIKGSITGRTVANVVIGNDGIPEIHCCGA